MIRRAFTMRLKPDSSTEYKYHHDNIWPELVAEIEHNGIASITTFQRDLDLFVVSEIADEAAWDRLWNSDIHKRWVEVMEPLLHLRDDGIVDASELDEVFHLTANGNGNGALTAVATERQFALEEFEEQVSVDPIASAETESTGANWLAAEVAGDLLAELTAEATAEPVPEAPVEPPPEPVAPPPTPAPAAAPPRKKRARPKKPARKPASKKKKPSKKAKGKPAGKRAAAPSKKAKKKSRKKAAPQKMVAARKSKPKKGAKKKAARKRARK